MSERTVRGRIVELSREDKVLFPDCGLTKGGLADHLEKVATSLLPHWEGRTLALQRFPDGIEEPSLEAAGRRLARLEEA